MIPRANAGAQKDLEDAYAWLNIKVKPVNPAAQWAVPVSDNSSIDAYAIKSFTRELCRM